MRFGPVECARFCGSQSGLKLVSSGYSLHRTLPRNVKRAHVLLLKATDERRTFISFKTGKTPEFAKAPESGFSLPELNHCVAGASVFHSSMKVLCHVQYTSWQLSPDEAVSM
eukprot:441259-Amphidinium_carterae.1